MIDEMLRAVQSSQPGSIETVLFRLVVAFVIGQLNAWCYIWTHRGVSYSRTFAHALILISIAASFSMLLVATNFVAAFGLLGGLAIIRFRTVVRDSRDTAYVLLCMVCGMAAGFGMYSTAMVGALTANAISLYLHLSRFGARHSIDSLLRFQVDPVALDSALFDAILRRFCRLFSVISVDDVPRVLPGGQRVCQCAYKVRLRDPNRASDLVAELKEAFGIDAVHLLVQQENEDVV